MKLIIRHDDFDMRMEPEEYIANHEKFINAGLIETAVIQYTHDGREGRFPPKLIKYMNTAPNWDIQFHCWSHDDYTVLPKWRIYDDIQKAKLKSLELFGKEPTTWFPPWNGYSEHMQEIADLHSLQISHESNDICKFIHEMKAGTFTGTSVYFHLWNHNESIHIDEMLEYAKQYENFRP
jgi:peptidoglycan/xylan/chitin deacetylase (PgdA/CDA1 family)